MLLFSFAWTLLVAMLILSPRYGCFCKLDGLSRVSMVNVMVVG